MVGVDVVVQRRGREKGKYGGLCPCKVTVNVKVDVQGTLVALLDFSAGCALGYRGVLGQEVVGALE